MVVYGKPSGQETYISELDHDPWRQVLRQGVRPEGLVDLGQEVGRSKDSWEVIAPPSLFSLAVNLLSGTVSRDTSGTPF